MSDWQEVIDENSGAPYYYNATTGETSWTIPEGFGGAATSNASAGGEWQEVMDESSGLPYYYNATSGETVWEKPAGFGGTAANASASEPAGAAAGNDDEDADEDTLADLPASPRKRAGTRTRKRSTSRKGSILQRKGSVAQVNVKTMSLEEQLSYRSKRYIQQRKTVKNAGRTNFARKRGQTLTRLRSASSMSGPDTPATPTAAGGATLPAGWIAAQDESSGATYYFNESTGVTQWDMPTE